MLAFFWILGPNDYPERIYGSVYHSRLRLSAPLLLAHRLVWEQVHEIPNTRMGFCVLPPLCMFVACVKPLMPLHHVLFSWSLSYFPSRLNIADAKIKMGGCDTGGLWE